MRSRKDNPAIAYLLILPAFSLVVGLLLVPMGQNIYYSFFKWDGISKPIFTGLGNYLRFFSDSNFLRSFSNTLIWVAATLVFPVGGGLVIAIFIRGMRGGGFFKSIFFLPLTISFVSTGAVWSLMFSRDLGILNGLIGIVAPGVKVNWLTWVPLNTYSMILAWIWQNSAPAWFCSSRG